MLVSNSSALNDKPVALKLVSGEEIIAKLVGETPDEVKLSRPLSLVMMAGEMDSQGMVAFAPWMLGLPDDAQVTLRKATILHMGKAREDAAQQYLTAVGGDRPASAPKGATGNNTAARR